MEMRVNIVPIDNPTADGRWITIPNLLRFPTSFGQAKQLAKPFVPAGFEVAAFDHPEEVSNGAA